MGFLREFLLGASPGNSAGVPAGIFPEFPPRVPPMIPPGALSAIFAGAPSAIPPDTTFRIFFKSFF